VPNKKIFRKKYGVTGLVFRYIQLMVKKWVKFVAMQQNSAILFSEFNAFAMKGTVESYLKKTSTAIQNSTVANLKNCIYSVILY